MRSLLAAAAVLVAGCTGAPRPHQQLDAGADAGTPLRVLAFTRTTGFRHASIPAARAALTQMAADRGWGLLLSEDPADFSDQALAETGVVVFLLTSGDVLGPDQKGAFERFI